MTLVPAGVSNGLPTESLKLTCGLRIRALMIAHAALRGEVSEARRLAQVEE
jgi:hypothetical protein